MTNAEKIAKNTEFLARLIIGFDCHGILCEHCPLCDNPCCLSEEQTAEWLESEVYQ